MKTLITLIATLVATVSLASDVETVNVQAEQPITRPLGGVVIPRGTTEVMIRARDNVDGWTATTFPYRMP